MSGIPEAACPGHPRAIPETADKSSELGTSPDHTPCRYRTEGRFLPSANDIARLLQARLTCEWIALAAIPEPPTRGDAALW